MIAALPAVLDRSCSYEEFNTLASIKTGNQSIHLRKMEYRIRKHPDAFVCSKCGGIYFLLLGKDKKPTCANCGAKVAMPSPAVTEKFVAVTSTAGKSAIVTAPAASTQARKMPASISPTQAKTVTASTSPMQTKKATTPMSSRTPLSSAGASTGTKAVSAASSGTKAVSAASSKTATGFTPADNFVPVQNPFPLSQQKTLSLLPAIAGGTTHTVARQSDGRVVAIGNDTFQCCSETAKWTDIIAVAASQFHTVGLKANGTAVAAGGSFYRKETLSQEKNIGGNRCWP